MPAVRLHRRPPPSTSYPCPAWSCRPRRPLFCRGEAAVGEALVPAEPAGRLQRVEEGPPDVEPDAVLLPLSQPPPAGGVRRVPPRQGLPPGPVTQHPQDALDDRPVGGRLGPAGRGAGVVREPGGERLPLLVGQ